MGVSRNKLVSIGLACMAALSLFQVGIGLKMMSERPATEATLAICKASEVTIGNYQACMQGGNAHEDCLDHIVDFNLKIVGGAE